jgi:hypothetical protein
MFNFIKKWLGEAKEEPVARKQISSFEEAEQVIAEKKQAADMQLAARINTAKLRIEHEKEILKEKIESLRKAKLLNPNIPERAKHFADGNRDAYIKKAEQFSEGIELPEKIDELNDFFNRFDSSIVELAESSAKPYQILQEFFANETNAIRGAIGAMEKTVLELKEALKAMNLEALEQLNNKIHELKNKIGQHREVSREFNERQNAVDDLELQKKQASEEIQEAEGDREYVELKQKLIASKESIKKIENELLSSFAVLETALKKYAKVSFEYKETAENYLKSPIAALSQDFELNIASCLLQIKASLIKDELDVKERKKEKTLEEIAKLSKENLQTIVKNYAAAKKEEQNALASLGESETFRKIKQLREKLANLEQELARARQEAEQLKKKAEKSELEQTKKEIVEKTNNLF